MAATQREKDKDFISWCIDQYLDGKVSAFDTVNIITITVKPNGEERGINVESNIELPVTMNG